MSNAKPSFNQQVVIKPKEGVVVRDAISVRKISSHGEVLSWSPYWARKQRQGLIEVSTDVQSFREGKKAEQKKVADERAKKRSAKQKTAKTADSGTKKETSE